MNGKGLVPLERVRSFVPAFKHTMHGISSYLLKAVAQRSVPCKGCGRPVAFQVYGSQPWFEARSDHAIRRQFWVRGICLSCGKKMGGFSADDAVFWSTPMIWQFIQQHPRWLNEPDAPIEYQGQPAILFHLADHTSAARLDVIVHRETLSILAILQA